MMRSSTSGVHERHQVPSGWTAAIGPCTHTRGQFENNKLVTVRHTAVRAHPRAVHLAVADAARVHELRLGEPGLEEVPGLQAQRLRAALEPGLIATQQDVAPVDPPCQSGQLMCYKTGQLHLLPIRPFPGRPAGFGEDSSGERSLAGQHPVIVMRCPECGVADADTATRCRNCGNNALDRTESPGRGRLVSWTVVRRPAGAFAHRDAFAVALVDLDAGPRLTGNLEGWEREPPLGAAVRVTGEIDGIPLFAVSDETR